MTFKPNKTKKTSYISRSLFLFIFIFGIIFHSCQKEEGIPDFKEYILEDQGTSPDDTSFHFNIYSSDITGDGIEDKIYIATYMSNYFGYVFDGKKVNPSIRMGKFYFHTGSGNETGIQGYYLRWEKRNHATFHFRAIQ